ncbi:SDR family NAD(P)-dependent oxidoreductase [Brevundimonas diminuta]|uniref:SDR family NAD(P)-dependent oxidoreductase n=1 Tax=Brevundimonas diminuta TaxID=293 RepID=UPI00320914AB
MQIHGTASVVSGGASGLGAATARMLAHRGAKVVIFDVDRQRGESLAKEIGARFFEVDVTDEASVEAGLSGAREKVGDIRLLVNCAGVGPAARTIDRDGRPHALAMFRKVIDVNLIGSFCLASRVAAGMSALVIDDEERGVIINTASVAAFDGQVGQAAYAASKAGIAGLTLPMARDLASHRIRVMTIAPGLFLTPLLETLPEAARTSLGAQVPFPSRLGRPEEFAALVESIVTNPMLNGETIRLDGAIRMAPR